MVTITDRSRLDVIRKSLDLLGSKESSFIRVELLFFDALSIARTYGNDLQVNALLAALKKVQQDAYEKTKEVCKTSQRKERLIRQFIVQFKKSITGKSILIG